MRVYRVNSLPGTLEPGAIYVVALAPDQAEQYFVGVNGVARRIVADASSVADWASITGKPSDFPPSAHTHIISDVTGLQAALDGKQASGSYAPTAHSHIIADVTGLQSALDGKQVAGSYQPLSAVLTATTAAFTSAQETKLAGIATGATVNASDAALRDRATHTGAQAIATVTGLQTALDGKQPLATVLTNTTAAFTTAQETKLAGVATGATANVGTVTSVGGTGTVSGLTLTGTVSGSGNLTLGGTLSTTSAALTDFDSASRAQTEAALIAGANVTITPSGSGASRQLTIAATGGGGGAAWDHLISLEADYALTNTTAVQKLFNVPTNGRITLTTGFYEFHCKIALTAMSATSGNFSFDLLGAGTATLTRQHMDAGGVDNNSAINGTAIARGGATALLTNVFGLNIVTAGTGTAAVATITGFFACSVAGTIIPSINLRTAATAIAEAGTIFACRRFGNHDQYSLGSVD